MSDEVSCVCVLKLARDDGPDSLLLAVPPDWKLRILSCRPKGTPRRGGGAPEWEYRVVREPFNLPGELELDPSMLCSDHPAASAFHTGNPWRCKYVVAEGAAYRRFEAENKRIIEGGGAD